MAEETKRGAGQYFTPRVLIDVIVHLMQPEPGEVIQDPAAGTGGFLIAADHATCAKTTDDYFDAVAKGSRRSNLTVKRCARVENVPDTFRLLQMNLHLHNIDPDHLDLSRYAVARAGPRREIQECRPDPDQPAVRARPAGRQRATTLRSPIASRPISFRSSNTSSASLKLGGRAAVIVPDNVLFDDGKRQARFASA